MNLIEAYANLDNATKKQRLDEKIPRDLANAMKRRGSLGAEGINDRRQGYQPYTSYPDFENNEYNEITPEEAMKLKREGKAGKIKALVNGQFIDFYDDGSTNYKSDSVRNSFGTLVKNAQKVYFVDDSKANAKEKRAQRDKNNSLTYYAGAGYWSDNQPRAAHASTTGDTGKHAKLPSWVAVEERDIQDYTQELSDLEKAWEDGDISRNEYNRKKEYLQGEIEYYKKSVKQDKEKYGNNEYKHRYDADAKRMQSKLNRYRDIKERPAEQDVSRRKTEVTQAEKNYQEKIAQKEKEIAKLQQEVDKLKSDRNNDWHYEWANDNLKKAEANLAQQKKDLADMKSGKWSVDDLPESLRRRNRRPLKEEYNWSITKIPAIGITYTELVDEMEQYGIDIVNDSWPDSEIIEYLKDIYNIHPYDAKKIANIIVDNCYDILNEI